MFHRSTRYWVFLWLCSLPLIAHAEFVNQVDSVIMLLAILFLGVPLTFLLLYLFIRFLKRHKSA